MKQVGIMVIAIFLAMASHAQNSNNEERWYEGYLVTTKQDTIRGELSYNMATNMVKVRQMDQIRVFTSFQTFHYKLYDESYRRWRRFFSIPFSLKTDHETPILFELLSEGKLSLLARERWANNERNSELLENRHLRKDFFLIDQQGVIRHTHGRKSQMLKMMNDHEEDLRVFIRDQHLDLMRERDLRILTTHYNRLSTQESLDREKELVRTPSSPPSDLILGALNEGTQIWMRTDL